MPLYLREVNRYNWEQCAALQLAPEQQQFIPSNLYTIAQSKYENLTLHALQLDEQIIGMAAIGYFAKIHWISRIMIHAPFQHLGYGTAFLRLLLDEIVKDPKATEVRAAVHPNNLSALSLFYRAGFHTLGTLHDNEIILYKSIR